MIEVKIRESKENKLSEDFSRLDGFLTHDFDKELIHSIVWSFQSDSDGMFHSGNATQDTYLNYTNPEQPRIEIKLPKQGTYNVNLVARINVLVEKDIEIKELDENNNIVITNELRTVLDIFEGRSNSIEITWDDTDGQWA
jgi:hypothetical protein